PQPDRRGEAAGLADRRDEPGAMTPLRLRRRPWWERARLAPRVLRHQYRTLRRYTTRVQAARLALRLTWAALAAGLSSGGGRGAWSGLRRRADGRRREPGPVRRHRHGLGVPLRGRPRPGVPMVIAQAAVERAMRMQEVILRAVSGRSAGCRPPISWASTPES